MMLCMPDFVRVVLNTLEAPGFKAWLVGGCLRDMLLGRAVHDWDLATTARGADVVKLFPKTVETGIRFGTITVVTGGGPVEVTTLRSDGAYSDRRRPDQVRFIDDLREDLKRRDFTINAMAMTAIGDLSDFFDGQGDLKRRLIRCVGSPEDRFSEDALRMFRALRFSAQLGFDIEAATMDAIRKCAPLCAALSAERVRDETEKILMSDKPGYISSAVALGLYAGRLDKAGSQPADLSGIERLPSDRQLRWSALCAVLLRAGLIKSAQSFLHAMRLDAKNIRYCGAGAAAAVAGPLPEKQTAFKRLLFHIGTDAARCAAAADEVLYGGTAVSRVEEAISSGECYSIAELAVTGDDLIALGYAPGIQLGLLLKQLLEHVIDHPEDNKREILMSFAKEFM